MCRFSPVPMSEGCLQQLGLASTQVQPACRNTSPLVALACTRAQHWQQLGSSKCSLWSVACKARRAELSLGSNSVAAWAWVHKLRMSAAQLCRTAAC